MAMAPSILTQAMEAAKASGTPFVEAAPSLINSESGGNWGAQNNAVGAGGKAGHFGRVQFGHARLQEAMDAGAIPRGTTPQAFMANPDMQKAAEGWHFGDIDSHISSNGLDKFVGQSINGVPVTQEGMRAVAHLGGKGGLQKFLQSGGQYNPSDANGTSLLDYLKKHGAGGISPDAPAPGAAEAQGFAVPPGSQPSLGARFMAGGPGALFGAPQAGWNLADTGLGVGAALMARDNPAGAAALLKIKEGDRRAAKQDVVSTSVINGGKSILQTKTDGSYSIKPSGIEGEAKPPPPAIAKEYTERYENMGKLASDATELARFQELIADGKLDVSASSRAAAVARNVIGKSNENDRYIAEFDSFVEKMTNNRLLLANGVQTNGDYQRAARENFSGGSSYDNANTLQRLQKIQSALKNDINRVADVNDGFAKTYKGIDADGTLTTRQKEWRSVVDESEKVVGPKREAYLKSRSAPPPGATAAPAPSEAPKEWRWTPKK